MKKLLLPLALALTSALASTAHAASTMTPLTGHVELYSEAGLGIGSVRGGLVELQPGLTLKDVSALRVVQAVGSEAHNRYYMSMEGAPTLMWFGPQGQPVALKLSLLSRVEWLSASGRLSRMDLTSE